MENKSNLDQQLRNVSNKRCHNCLKSLPFWEFFPINLGGVYFQSNNCIDCYLNGYHDKSSMKSFGVDRDWIDGFEEKNGKDAASLKDSYECAFVGNTSYKDICKVFHISYEK